MPRISIFKFHMLFRAPLHRWKWITFAKMYASSFTKCVMELFICSLRFNRRTTAISTAGMFNYKAMLFHNIENQCASQFIWLRHISESLRKSLLHGELKFNVIYIMLWWHLSDSIVWSRVCFIVLYGYLTCTIFYLFTSTVWKQLEYTLFWTQIDANTVLCTVLFVEDV